MVQLNITKEQLNNFKPDAIIKNRVSNRFRKTQSGNFGDFIVRDSSRVSKDSTIGFTFYCQKFFYYCCDWLYLLPFNFC